MGIGYDNGDIKIYDLRMDKLLYGQNFKYGICSIEFDKKNIPINKMVATTLDSKIYLFDLKNLEKDNNLRCEKLMDKIILQYGELNFYHKTEIFLFLWEEMVV